MLSSYGVGGQERVALDLAIGQKARGHRVSVLIDEIQPGDWVVLELSSFQLIDLQHSPHIAVCLMVVPEHLNWHADMAEYVAAKASMFLHQSSDDRAVY